MKRYWLFAGEEYYPLGGMKDFRGSFETDEAAMSALTKSCDWWHILDSHTGKVVGVQDN